MELTAVIEGLKLLKFPCKVKLYSDSAYVVNAFLQKPNDKSKKMWYNKNKKEREENKMKNYTKKKKAKKKKKKPPTLTSKGLTYE